MERRYLAAPKYVSSFNIGLSFQGLSPFQKIFWPPGSGSSLAAPECVAGFNSRLCFHRLVPLHLSPSESRSQTANGRVTLFFGSSGAKGRGCGRIPLNGGGSSSHAAACGLESRR